MLKDKGGNPAKLTPEFTAKMVDAVKLGSHPEVAAIAAGISRASYYDWKRLAEEGQEPFLAWWTEVTRAVAESELSLLNEAKAGDEVGVGHGPSKAALAILQLRFPKRWSTQIKVEVGDQLNRFIDAAQRVCDPETFRKLLEELAEESGEGEAPPAPSHELPRVH